MEIINRKKIASVSLAEVSISQDELEVFETAIKFALKKLTEDEIEMLFGATKEELEGSLEDLQLISQKTDKHKLEPAF